MEDGLVQVSEKSFYVPSAVLILVLMEDGLVLTAVTAVAADEGVLILVLMEDGLVQIDEMTLVALFKS